MFKCPECGRILVAYDPFRAEWRCLWYGCRYILTDSDLESCQTEKITPKRDESESKQHQAYAN